MTLRSIATTTAAVGLVCLAAPAPSAEPPAPTGIETGDLDRSRDPCSDLDGFANGSWRAKNPPPPSSTGWSRRRAAIESTRERLKAILEEAQARTDWPRGSVEQEIGDYYGACMDEKRVNDLGLEPLKPVLADIDAITGIDGVQRVIERLHEMGIAAPFGLRSKPDRRDPTRTIAEIQAAGLGLRDRDDYLNPEPRVQEIRGKYKLHVAHMLELAGASREDSRTGAQAVFALEKQLAEASLTKGPSHERTASEHRTTFVALTNLTPMFDWPAYFTAARLPRSALDVEEPEFLKALDRALGETALAGWKSYLRWHLVHAAAPALSTPFVQEDFGFYGKTLGGAREPEPRWERCVESAERELAGPLARKYVEKYLPPQARSRVQELVQDLLLAAGDTIRGLSGVSAATKAKALAKLSRLRVKVGHPDPWPGVSQVRITREAYWDDVVASRRLAVADDLAQIGKPVDRSRWPVTPLSPAVHYDPLLDELVVPAATLQPPLFDANAADAVNHGAIGVAVGRELARGLGLWSPDGQPAPREAAAELAGAKIAYRAFALARETRPAPAIDGFTPERQFFVAWAQSRGDAITPEGQRLLASLPEFTAAFGCPADAPTAPPANQR